MPYYINQAPMNPVSRVIASMLAVLAVVGAVFFGLIVLVVVFGLGLLLWLGIRLRMWWILRNQPRNQPRTQAAPDPQGEAGEVIDAEYTVVSRKPD
jgi:hypothetical protein